MYSIDFYCDKLSGYLLRRLYLETEKTSQIDVDFAKSKLGLIDAVVERQKQTVKPFSMEDIFNLRFKGEKLQMPNSEGDLDLLRDWTSEQIVLALHSEGQDVILEQLNTRFNFEKNMKWDLMKKLGVPLWLKYDSKLMSLIETIAKNEYKFATGEGGTSKAEFCALWYVLAGKLSVLQKLFNVETGGKKFADFIGSDFTLKKPKIIAAKNALALVGKKKYTLACAFLLLGGDLYGAC